MRATDRVKRAKRMGWAAGDWECEEERTWFFKASCHWCRVRFPFAFPLTLCLLPLPSVLFFSSCLLLCPPASSLQLGALLLHPPWPILSHTTLCVCVCHHHHHLLPASLPLHTLSHQPLIPFPFPSLLCQWPSFLCFHALGYCSCLGCSISHTCFPPKLPPPLPLLSVASLFLFLYLSI